MLGPRQGDVEQVGLAGGPLGGPGALTVAAQHHQHYAFFLALEGEVASSLPTDLYEVQRTAFLNADQHRKSVPLAVLQPGEVVNVVERAGKWTRVERFDKTHDAIQQGWVLKKYMMRLE